MRKLAVGVALALLAACSGGSSSPSPSSSSDCTLTFSGGASETVACTTTLRANGSGGYVLWLAATRGGGASMEQAGMFKLAVTSRPVVDVDYGWTATTVPSNIGQSYAERWVDGTKTHEAMTLGPTGALAVRFSEIPADDGADPTGLAGIGTVHGTVTGTLPPVSGGADVTVSGAF